MIRLAPKNMFIAVLTLFIGLMANTSASYACDGQTEIVVNEYLTGLLTGDVESIEQLVDGKMAKRASRHFRNPIRYGDFLRAQYQQVDMTIVSTTHQGDACHVSVHFSYPSGDTEEITLVLSPAIDTWRIIDELVPNTN